MDKENRAHHNRRLKHMRELAGWTQEILAEKIGTTIVNISRWENGSSVPSAYYRRKLCEIFNKDAYELGLLEKVVEDGEADSQQNISSRKAIRQSGNELPIIWPLAIPDERYYHLPKREESLNRLFAMLQDPQDTLAIVIDGLAGMGKTALAVELSKRLMLQGVFEGIVGDSAKQELFVGGEIIRVSEATLDFNGLLDTIARQLDCWELLTLTFTEKHIAIVQLLRRQPYMILIDNLETAENAQALVAHLRSLLGISRAIITSREQVRHDFCYSYSLRGLELDDTSAFLQQELALQGRQELLNLSREKIVELHNVSGGAPLALKLVLAQTRFLDLDRVLDQLQHAENKLYSFMFRQSWRHLSYSARSILTYIGSTVVTTIGWEELANAGLVENNAALVEAIDQLVASSLLETSLVNSQIRYSIHQLTRQFVLSELPNIWQEQEL
ncbi:helix-turn-helix domain-containing protein [Reticulibacter mediterranei]|nr:helix-turn-helix domain-containing protein [Reticulibacter mediterranei]